MKTDDGPFPTEKSKEFHQSSSLRSELKRKLARFAVKGRRLLSVNVAVCKLDPSRQNYEEILWNTELNLFRYLKEESVTILLQRIAL